MSQEIKPKFFRTAHDFRKWLGIYHTKKDELWVGYHKRATGKLSMTWPESVNEALCYGWIDGIRKSIDDRAYMIRFTPRRPNSIWSAVNIKNFETLKRAGLILPAGQGAFDAKKEKHTNRYSFEQGTLTLLPAYEKKFKSNKTAWEFFQSLPPSVKKPSIWYVMSAKREDTQLRRLFKLMRCSEKGQRIPELRRG